jgi:ABC-type transporter Mla MlaB component
MRITEIDLQSIVLIKLRGKLDRDAVRMIVKKTQDFLDNNQFKVIIDLRKVQIDDISLISLSTFLNDLKQKEATIKIVPSSKGDLAKIELYKLPVSMSMPVFNTKLH